jgi:hypothetical protein
MRSGHNPAEHSVVFDSPFQKSHDWPPERLGKQALRPCSTIIAATAASNKP